MTPDILVVLMLVLVVSVALITERLRPDLAALLLLVVLGLSGLVPEKDLFSGFSRSAVITILALSIITNGLERTGATQWIGQALHRWAGTTEGRAVWVVMVGSALLSLVMNTIAAAAVLLPAVVGLTRASDLRPARLFIPLAFGALLGGMATLFTTANILVSAALSEAGFTPYGVLDFLPSGLPMALVGMAFIATAGRHLLPNRVDSGLRRERPALDLAEVYNLRGAISLAYVKPGSPMAGRSIADGGWGRILGLNVVGVSRGGRMMLAPAPHLVVIEGDIVLFSGIADDEELDRFGLIRTEDPDWSGQLASDTVSLVEATLAPRSAVAGKTLREMRFRELYDLTLLALWRDGHTLREGLADLPLKFGDALLLQGSRDKVRLLKQDEAFIVLDPDEGKVDNPRKAALAVTLTVLAVILSALNLLPIAEATFAAAVLMVFFGCLTMEQAYAAIEWRTIFLIVGMLPLGLALTSTGAAAWLGTLLVTTLGPLGPLAVAAGLFVTATGLTQIISGQVTPVVLAPIAIAAAQSLGVDPRGMGMAVALACSTAFITPISHSVNMLVMGPGGYTFRDYARIGWPLTALMLLTLLITLALFWF